MLAHPTAIAYLRADVSGARQAWDEIHNRSLAKRLGYNLARTVVFSEHTDDPIARLINVVGNLGAQAVIVPRLDHFGGQVPDALVEVADVITVDPHDTYSRRIIPPAESRSR